jgi:NADH-quinone oxidoreductase subunit M
MQELATPLLWLALATIIFSAFAALAQTDMKRLLAYSSINHLGYCLLGIFAVAAVPDGSELARAAATNGVLLQIFNHGLTASALFAFVAFTERRSGGLRGLGDFGGLRTAAPVLAGLMGIAIFSSIGLPGLNGFVGEFLIFSGTFPLVGWATALAVIGLFVTAVFLLGMIQKVFTGPLPERWSGFPDLTRGEILTVAPAIALMFVLGIFPQLLIAIFNKP